MVKFSYMSGYSASFAYGNNPFLVTAQRQLGKTIDTLPGINGMSFVGKAGRLYNTDNIRKLNNSFNSINPKTQRVISSNGFIRPAGQASSPRPYANVTTKNPAMLATNPRQQANKNQQNRFAWLNRPIF